MQPAAAKAGGNALGVRRSRVFSGQPAVAGSTSRFAVGTPEQQTGAFSGFASQQGEGSPVTQLQQRQDSSKSGPHELFEMDVDVSPDRGGMTAESMTGSQPLPTLPTHSSKAGGTPAHSMDLKLNAHPSDPGRDSTGGDDMAVHTSMDNGQELRRIPKPSPPELADSSQLSIIMETGEASTISDSILLPLYPSHVSGMADAAAGSSQGGSSRLRYCTEPADSVPRDGHDDGATRVSWPLAAINSSFAAAQGNPSNVSSVVMFRRGSAGSSGAAILESQPSPRELPPLSEEEAQEGVGMIPYVAFGSTINRTGTQGSLSSGHGSLRQAPSLGAQLSVLVGSVDSQISISDSLSARQTIRSTEDEGDEEGGSARKLIRPMNSVPSMMRFNSMTGRSVPNLNRLNSASLSPRGTTPKHTQSGTLQTPPAVTRLSPPLQPGRRDRAASGRRAIRRSAVMPDEASLGLLGWMGIKGHSGIDGEDEAHQDAAAKTAGEGYHFSNRPRPYKVRGPPAAPLLSRTVMGCPLSSPPASWPPAARLPRPPVIDGRPRHYAHLSQAVRVLPHPASARVVGGGLLPGEGQGIGWDWLSMHWREALDKAPFRGQLLTTSPPARLSSRA